MTYLFIHKTISPLYFKWAVSVQYQGADVPVVLVLGSWWLRRSKLSGLTALWWRKFLRMPDVFCSLLLSQKGIPSAPSAAYLVFGFASHPSGILVYSAGYPAHLLFLVLIVVFVLYLASFVTWVAVYMFSMHTTCNYTRGFLLFDRHIVHLFMWKAYMLCLAMPTYIRMYVAGYTIVVCSSWYSRQVNMNYILSMTITTMCILSITMTIIHRCLLWLQCPHLPDGVVVTWGKTILSGRNKQPKSC